MSAGLALLALVPFSGTLGAQTLGCAPGFTEIFVDQETGADLIAPGTPTTYPQWGCPLRPFKTITHALSQAPNHVPVTLVINPGFYDTASGETFPLNMRRNVSIQGTNAVNTILIAPPASFDGCTTGEPDMVALTSSLLLFDAQQAEQFDQVNVDSVTIRGGCIGIAITGEHPCNPTISNCFIVDGALSGIDISSATSESAVHRPKILHCTFTINRTAITNRTFSTFPGTPPADPPSAPGILNILAARSFDGNPLTPDFYGIRDIDMLSTNNGFTESTSGFDIASPLGLGLCQGPTGPTACLPPQNPGFSPAGANANLFIDDVVSQGSWDLRLHPNISEDFPTPVDNAFDPEGELLIWNNGTVGDYSLANGAKVGDFDCEGYGNPRFDGLAHPDNAPDMGADEMGTYIVGGYSGATTSLFQSSTVLEWVGPFLPTDEPRAFTTLEVPSPSHRYIDSGQAAPGNRPRKTVLPYSVPGRVRESYLQTPFLTVPFSIPSSPQPPPPPTPPPSVATRTLFNAQVAFGNGPHTMLSNLQTFLVNP